MYALAIALLGAMLVAWNISVTEPRQIVNRQQIEGKAAAANFWAYRSAVARYNFENRGDTGRTIPDGNLTFPQGFNRIPPWAWTNGARPWSNFVENGTLYTYSTSATPLPAAIIDAIAGRGVRTLTIGIAQRNGAQMEMSSFINGAVVFPLPAPAAIPPGAVVVIGN